MFTSLATLNIRKMSVWCCRSHCIPKTIRYKYSQFQSQFGFCMLQLKAWHYTQTKVTLLAVVEWLFVCLFLSFAIHLACTTISKLSCGQPVQRILHFRLAYLNSQTAGYIIYLSILFMGNNKTPTAACISDGSHIPHKTWMNEFIMVRSNERKKSFSIHFHVFLLML
jgi:hypothetical protein